VHKQRFAVQSFSVGWHDVRVKCAARLIQFKRITTITPNLSTFVGFALLTMVNTTRTRECT